jgi:hypothetical protein
MKRLLQILFLIDIIGLSYGFYIKSENVAKGDLIIGLTLVLGFFIVMPLFIYHRWKNKNVKDYMLTKENIEKMREFNDSKDNKS